MITVIGAGMAGLLAAGMLRNECSLVVEKQEELPNNHSAVLRFRSPIVGDTLNIPFNKVKVMKWVYGGENPVANALNYSFKTNGQYSLRSSTTANGEIVERWIAPSDLIQQMKDRVMADFQFGHEWSVPAKLGEMKSSISTLPMPVLMELLDYPKAKRPLFPSVTGTNITAIVEGANAYVSIYVTPPHLPFNRVSLTGHKLIVECAWPFGREAIDHHQLVDQALQCLGIPHAEAHTIEFRESQYAKIMPTDDRLRKDFIVWASDNFDIWSLGRFATWRPGLLLDDLVNDVRQIHHMINNGNYDRRK